VVGRRATINRSRDYRLRCPARAHPRFCVTTLGKLFTPMCCGSTPSLRYYSHSLNRARLPLTTRYAWVQHNKGGYSTFRDSKTREYVTKQVLMSAARSVQKHCLHSVFHSGYITDIQCSIMCLRSPAYCHCCALMANPSTLSVFCASLSARLITLVS